MSAASSSLYSTTSEGLSALRRAFRRAHLMYKPAPILSLSEWADRYAFVPPESGAMPGKFRTSFAEYQRGIQDAITDPGIETVVLMLCAQSGKSQIQLNTIGYYTHWEPSPMLVVQPSQHEAEKFSKNRIAKMIRDTSVLRDIYPPARSRDSGNTLLNKEFPGGVLVIASANSPASLSSMPIRILLPDEVDRYEASSGTEGDPVDLAEKRTTSFWNRKIVMASTPAFKNLSRIESGYEASDKRRYYVPCPHCGAMQQLQWKRMQWKTQVVSETSPQRLTDWWYVCENGCEIRERHKHEMIRLGEWRATAQSHDGKTAGFHLNALYSPFLDWSKIIQEWLAAQHSLERLKTFVNTRLAETWEIRGTGADLHALESRKENYSELVPDGVLFLTAGVDVQDNRLEASVIGWGINEERWVIDHAVFPSAAHPCLPDPSLPESDSRSPWASLREYLLQDWKHASGLEMRVSCAMIDSGGHNTERVYDFTRRHELRRWYAIIGRGGIGRPLVNSGTRVGPFRTLLFTVGVDTAKEDIFTSFRTQQEGAGFCHFNSDLPTEYFRQVTAEKLVAHKENFVSTLRWEKTSERNEALDCFVYARAAVAALRPNFTRLKRNFDRAVAAQRPSEKAAQTTPEKPSSSATKAPVVALDIRALPEVSIPVQPTPKPRRTSVADQLRSRLR